METHRRTRRHHCRRRWSGYRFNRPKRRREIKKLPRPMWPVNEPKTSTQDLFIDATALGDSAASSGSLTLLQLYQDDNP